LRYFPYYGRGYVQLTWEKNYEKYSRILDVDLVSEPDRALNADIALFVLVHGFKTGVFTGRKITDYIDENSTDFVNARRCINGRDHANDIAQIAENFLEGL
ncbi:MAG: glycoside hydrolase family 19 protein, partial [Gammaproteobacteria bacterium]